MMLPRILIRSQVSAAPGLLFVSGLLGQNNFFRGSTPSGTASSTPLALTLDDAIQRGLQFNLGLLESQAASQTARADRIQALSSLLPQVTGTLAEPQGGSTL
jgi:outer membrane protein TolC